MNEEEEDLIVCRRIYTERPGPIHVPSKEANCAWCQALIRVADSSPPGTLICTECSETIHEDEIEIHISPEQRRELNEHGLDDEMIERTLKLAEQMRKEGRLHE